MVRYPKRLSRINTKCCGAEIKILVSAEQSESVVKQISVLSEKGSRCTIVNPWHAADVQLVRNGTPSEVLSDERLVFDTKK